MNLQEAMYKVYVDKFEELLKTVLRDILKEEPTIDNVGGFELRYTFLNQQDLYWYGVKIGYFKTEFNNGFKIDYYEVHK